MMEPLGNSFFPTQLSRLFGHAVSFRNWLYDTFPVLSFKADMPVVCIGGIHAGGTGKTPMALLVGNMLVEMGQTVAFLSRGYKRKSKKNIVVAPNEPVSCIDAGDEPTLLHSAIPSSWLGIGANRKSSYSKLKTSVPPHTVFVLDDGYQHRQIQRDVDIVCLPVNVFESRMMPAGFLREPLHYLSRASALCVIGNSNETGLLIETKYKLNELFPRIPVFLLIQQPGKWVNYATKETKDMLTPKKPMVLSGIARPERFLNHIQSIGITSCKTICYNDHHLFLQREIDTFCNKGFDAILTTEKDVYRLAILNLVKCPDIWYLKLDLGFVDNKAKQSFNELLRKKLVR